MTVDNIHSDLIKLLWQKLQSAGLFPDQRMCKSGYADMMTTGFVERNFIVSQTGEEIWKAAFSAINRLNKESCCIHVLGMGYYLSEYLNQPLNLPKSEHKNVARLGALTHLIVSVHDAYFDQGAKRRFMLPQFLLKILISRRIPGVSSVCKKFGPEKLKMSVSLISEYFRQLDQLAYSTGNTSVYDTINRAIYRIYEAESDAFSTLVTRKTILSNIRKSTLQFMIMGLHGWLAVPEINHNEYRRHLKWLYEIGLFFRWIDDIVDIDEDLVTRRANLYLFEKKRVADSSDLDKRILDKIVRQGVKIQSEWERKCANTNDIPDITRNIFGICLLSSIGFFPDQKANREFTGNAVPGHKIH